MGKIRMVELAKEKNLKVVDLLSLAKQLDVDAKNAMSAVSVEDAAKLVANLDKIDNKPKESATVAASKKAIETPTMEKAVEIEKTATVAPAVTAPKATEKVVEKTPETKTETPAVPAFEIGKNASGRPQKRTDDRYQRREDRQDTYQRQGQPNRPAAGTVTRAAQPQQQTTPQTQPRQTAAQTTPPSRSTGTVTRAGQPESRSTGTVTRAGQPESRSTGTVTRAGQPESRSTGTVTRAGGQGGYQGQNRGYQGQNQGGYQGQNRGGQGQQGGYQGQNRGGQGQQGGYQGQNRGGQGQQGGYQGQNRGGQGQQGGYQGQNRGGQGQQGGYQGQNRGGQGQQGGYQGQNRGGQGQQGGYQGQNRGGYQGQNQGGYQGQNRGGQGQQGGYQGGQGQRRGSGMDNRNIERKLSDISAQAPASEVTQGRPGRSTYGDNRSRRNTGDERKSKKQLREERRLEDRRLEQQRREKAAEIERNSLPKIIKHKGSLTVGEISQQMGVPVSEIIKTLLGLDIIATINHMLDADAIEIVAAEFDATVEYEEQVDETDLSLAFTTEDDEANMVERPPVITIMGHVDHGKTTLLDALRTTSTDVTEGEAGGITQHIGAYQISHNGKKLTFLDTPGHEAFTSMRARGAQVTDIAIIVVAADDGVMPQTKEAVEHAKAAKVPIIVAVNKIDKPDADKTKVMQGLAELGLQSEEWGGDTIFVEISAKMKTGLDNLIEMILLVSELEELKANPQRAAFGTVIEASLDKGKGSVATLLVQGGTLRVGDPIVVGSTHGRVRAMENDHGKQVKEAGPSTPIEVTGLVGVPKAGDQFAVFETEKKARQIGASRATVSVAEDRRKSSAMNLEDLNQQILEGDVKEINILIKGDVQGSVEAVSQSFAKIDVQGVRVNIVRAGVGAISETDVNLALASNAIIYGFNVRPDANARQVAEAEGVEIRQHTIIYKAIEEIEHAMQGMLDPEYEEVITGKLEVRALFKVTKIGTIAGCMVTEGEIKRDSMIRLFRDGILVVEGKLGSLRRETNDAKQVSAGYECGVTIENYNDLKEGDIIEAYEMQEIERKF